MDWAVYEQSFIDPLVCSDFGDSKIIRLFRDVYSGWHCDGRKGYTIVLIIITKIYLLLYNSMNTN